MTIVELSQEEVGRTNVKRKKMISKVVSTKILQIYWINWRKLLYFVEVDIKYAVCNLWIDLTGLVLVLNSL